MSSFYCPKCQKNITIGITECVHFPLTKCEKRQKAIEMPEFMKDIFNFKK